MEIVKTNDQDRVWISISRTVNLGNYEAYKVEAGVSQAIKEEEDPFEVLHDLEYELSHFIKERSKKRRYKN